MIKLVFLFLLAAVVAHAHPGVGIVRDSRGNIFYTDLQQVWKITNGVRTVIVPNVHSHELHMSPNDDLYGEDVDYDERSDKFFHYLWVYHPDGTLDTVFNRKQAYIQQDFSLSRDSLGNEYYIKQFIVRPDTTHVFLKSPDGKERMLAEGKFKGIGWLHPQADGTLLYALHNAIYRLDALGNIHLVADNIGNAEPSFKFSGTSTTLWGIWTDKAKNIYVAVFSDQTVKKIDSKGMVSDYYHSIGNWAPLHGVFDNDNKLWLLEGSDKNEVRVTMADHDAPPLMERSKSSRHIYIVAGVIALGFLLYYFRFTTSKSRSSKMLV